MGACTLVIVCMPTTVTKSAKMYVAINFRHFLSQAKMKVIVQIIKKNTKLVIALRKDASMNNGR